MTVRLLYQYGKYPKNTNLSTGAEEEARLLREGLADTNTAAGAAYVSPTPDRRIDESPAGVIGVQSSRALNQGDNGMTLEVLADGVTLTAAPGLSADFACAIIPSGTTSVASSGGVLLNGATATLTRAAASNSLFGIQARASAPNSYVVTGS